MHRISEDRETADPPYLPIALRLTVKPTPQVADRARMARIAGISCNHLIRRRLSTGSRGVDEMIAPNPLFSYLSVRPEGVIPPSGLPNATFPVKLVGNPSK
jgi:hypothetical protein